MPELQIKMTDMERLAERFDGGAKQLPYVMSRLLNEGANAARKVLVQSTWPAAVKVRNPNFLTWALRVDYSTKAYLRATIYDAKDRGNLLMHATGGVKRARGANLAIPPPGTSYGARGLPKSQRPRAIVTRTPKRALRITPRGIFVGEGGRLHLKFSLQATAAQPKDVPFFEDFAYAVSATVRTGFDETMRKALR